MDKTEKRNGFLPKGFSPGFIQMTLVELEISGSRGMASLWHKTMMVKVRVIGTRAEPAPEVRTNRRHKLGQKWSKSRSLSCLPHSQIYALKLTLSSIETWGFPSVLKTCFIFYMVLWSFFLISIWKIQPDAVKVMKMPYVTYGKETSSNILYDCLTLLLKLELTDFVWILHWVELLVSECARI